MGLPMVGNGLCLTLNTPCSCNNYLSLLFHPFVQKCVKEQLVIFMKVIAIAPNNWALVSFQMTFINLCITLVKQCQCQHRLRSLTLLQSLISQSCLKLDIKVATIICSRLSHSFLEKCVKENEKYCFTLGAKNYYRLNKSKILWII